MEWISVEDRLPNNEQRILVSDGDFIVIDEFIEEEDDFYLESGLELVDEVSHWMPLPEPPKGEV